MKNISDKNKIEIMKAIKNIVVFERLKQREIAELLDIKQPRVSDLLSLKHDRFSLDILMGYLEKFGCVVSFEMNELTNRKTNLVSVKVLRCKTSYRSILPK